MWHNVVDHRFLIYMRDSGQIARAKDRLAVIGSNGLYNRYEYFRYLFAILTGEEIHLEQVKLLIMQDRPDARLSLPIHPSLKAESTKRRP